MAIPKLNNPGSVRGYMLRFERRFVRSEDEVVYVRNDGTGAVFERERAAALIAAMRATLYEADAESTVSAQDAAPVAIAAALFAVLAGAVTGYVGAGFALAMPVAAAVLLLGPGLSAFRLDMAWRRGLAAAEAQAARAERIDAAELRRHVPTNPLRTIATIAVVVSIAVAIGMVVAAASLPNHARVDLDRWFGRAIAPVMLVLIGLIFAGRLADTMFRRAVSEAEIDEAMEARRRRPFR